MEYRYSIQTRLERMKRHCFEARQQRARTDVDRPYRPPEGVSDRQENGKASEVEQGKISLAADRGKEEA